MAKSVANRKNKIENYYKDIPVPVSSKLKIIEGGININKFIKIPIDVNKNKIT